MNGEGSVDIDALEGDRLVELTVADLDTLAEVAAQDHGSATVESDDEAIEVLVAEPAPAVEEPLSNADFGGSDELVLPEDRVVEVLPDLARLAAIAATRTAAWGLGASLRMTRRLARASVDPAAAAELVGEVGEGMRAYAREFLGVSVLEARIDALTPVGDRLGPGHAATLPARAPRRLSPEQALRAQGALLLRQSAEVGEDEDLHPAFGRILGELAPDEGRILRLLVADGPQPVVDVRAVNLIGVGSQLVADKLNMIGMQSGVRRADRVAAYIVNLERLGLVAVTNTAVEDAIAYQVLEAQPEVMRTIRGTSRAKTVHRSLRLTPFGSAFAQACFPPEREETQALAEVEAADGPSDQGPMPIEKTEFGS